MTENQVTERSKRREKTGVVLSTKMNKTIIVNVERTYPHPVYKKIITRGKKYYAHDENNEFTKGDKVVIRECRPLSKMKRWVAAKKLEGNS